MPRRTPNPNRAKIHRVYTVDEAARALDVHKHTVRRWIAADGLEVVDDRRPLLIGGAVLRAFLTARRAKKRQRCGAGQLYCVSCRSPREPAGGFAEYLPLNPNSGNLRAICPVCDCLMHRRTTWEKLPLVCGPMEIALPQGESRLCSPASLSLNGELDEEGGTNANALA